MLNKSTEGHFVCVWLIVVLTCTTCYTAASGCNTTIDSGGSAMIYFPQDTSYCEISIITPADLSYKLSFSDFYLDCQSEYVKIWYLYPRRLLRHYCDNMGNKVVRIHQQYALVQYSASSSSEHDERYLQYKGYSRIPNRPGHHRKRGIGTTATVILLAVLILIGALVCGIGLAHYRRPRRRRERRRQPSVLQHMPVTPGLSKLPHLPNYFDNEGAVPPPYLESIGADGNPVYPPSCNENPPPYSILDTESTLETTGDTRATDRLDQSR